MTDGRLASSTVEDGNASRATIAIRIDTSEIPDRVRDDLAAATLDFIHDLLRQPGGREMIEAKKAAKAAR